MNAIARLLLGSARASTGFNFMTAILDSRITFTRSGSVATRFNSSGVLETVGANTPRFDYDPVTLAPRGLYIEQAATNLLLNSLIDGTNLATQSVTVTAQAYTLSFYGTGTVTLSGASTAGPLVGSGAFPTRSTLTFTPTAGSLTLTVSGTVQYAQLEAGSFVTSFVPTAGSQVTRTADIATVPVGSWYNASEGTLFVRGSLTLADGKFPRVLALGVAPLQTEVIHIIGNGASNVAAAIWNDGIANASFTFAAATQATFQCALAYRNNDCQAAFNGTASAVDTTVTLPTNPNALYIGCAETLASVMTGYIEELRYYPRRLTNAQLQALTS